LNPNRVKTNSSAKTEISAKLKTVECTSRVLFNTLSGVRDRYQDFSRVRLWVAMDPIIEQSVKKVSNEGSTQERSFFLSRVDARDGNEWLPTRLLRQHEPIH